MRYLIIGNSAAGIGGVEGIRRVDREGEITLVADEPYPTYSRPLISYYLEGRVAKDRLGYRPADFYEKNKVSTRLGERVERIDAAAGVALLAGGERLAYDRLLLATGSRPLTPPVKGLDKGGVFYFNRLDDVLSLADFLERGSRVAIIGAGLTGLKAAEALVTRGAGVTVADLAPRLLPAILDEEAAGIVQARLEQVGIAFRLGVAAARIEGGGTVEGLVLADGASVRCAAVVIAAGVRPNSQLAEEAGIPVERGILVNERMETGSPGIYAAGDVAQGWDPLLKEKRMVPTLPSAYRQGEVAGRNMAGEVISYQGDLPMNSVGFFGLNIATAGISNPLPAEGLTVLRKAGEGNYRSAVLCDGKLIGFIAVGEIRRTGILHALIKSGVPVAGLEERLLAADFGLADLPEKVRREWNWERGDFQWKQE